VTPIIWLVKGTLKLYERNRAVLTAEAIKAANDQAKRSKTRPVPEWGGDVLIKSWSGTDRLEFLKRTKDAAANGVNVPPDEFWAGVCVLGLVDEAGNPLFNGEGITTLLEKNATVVREIAEDILEHNALGKSAQERAAKNSMSNQSEDSGSASLAV